MPPQVIQIPTLNDVSSDFDQLFEIWNRVSGYSETVHFKFSHCYFLRPNAVAFLGGLARLIDLRLGSATFDWSSFIYDPVMKNLQQNGLFRLIGIDRM